MAKTVAEIDGDSSGLVSELDKAKAGMKDLGTQGKKLSDQLKEVADDADVAAGNLVNKLGGPGAIKAIAGVGIAYGAAQKGVEMFLDSSEKLFRSYGEKGQAAWDDLEKSLNDLNGMFAKAVLQTDDMYKAYGRLYAGLELLKTMSTQTIDTLVGGMQMLMKIPGFGIIPRKLGLYEAFDNMAKEGEARARELTSHLDKITKSFEKPVPAAKTLNESIDEMIKSYVGLTGSSVNFEEQQRKAALANIDNTVKQVEALALLQNMADNMSGENIGGLSDAQIESLERLGELRKQIVEGGKEPAAKPATGGGKGGKKGDEPETVAEMVARVSAAATARADAANEALALKEQNDKTEQELDMQKMRAELERIDAQNAEKAAKAQAFLDFTKQMELDHIAEIHARGELTAEEQDQLNADRLKAVQDRAGQEMGIYAQVAGKQLVLGKLSAKEAADMARKQLGNVIMGLGDKAMAEAGLMAASLNPLAVPMAAAGVAAYAIGGSLAADKKGAGSTPATEKAEAAAPSSNNYAFNLRVDSVFADGESVARQFAMMQESARQRGLLAQGAY